MRLVWLIALSFLRQQRTVIIVMGVYTVTLTVALTALADARHSAGDLIFPFRQLASYGVIIPFLLAGQALYTERRTRRILAILAKGVSRQQYLTSAWLACVLIAAIQLSLLGVVIQAAAAILGAKVEIWVSLLAALLAAGLAGAVALAFACFVHPFVAVFLSGTVLAIPAGLGVVFGPNAQLVLPVSYVIGKINSSDITGAWNGGWLVFLIAAAESAAILVLAGKLFKNVDVAEAIE